jgi:Glyoxalase-like domain
MRIAQNQKPAPGELYLDHVAHFVPDLGAAARVAESVGFVVTPESAHRAQGAPAGTSNRCIMLEEGYIEILAPTLDTPNAQRVREHMARYAGVHLACFGTPDAESEHRRLAGQGFEPEPVVNLERTLDDGETVRFSVVHVPPAKMPEGRIQYVQQLTPEQIWRPQHLKHRNGVVGLAAVYVAAAEPAQTAARWARFAGLLPRRDCDLVRLDAARGKVFVGKAEPAPALAGYALRCRDPEKFLATCRKAGLEVRKQSVLLPPALGGAWHVV